jgi:hypothetical protein
VCEISAKDDSRDFKGYAIAYKGSLKNCVAPSNLLKEKNHYIPARKNRNKDFIQGAGIEETFRFAFKGVSSHIPQQLAVIQTSDQDNPEQRKGTISHIGPTESSACHIRLAG